MKKPLELVATWWRAAIDNDVILTDYRSFKDLEGSVQGFPSTPSTDNITEIYESISSLQQQHLDYDIIRLTLEELSRFNSSKFNIPVNIEWHRITNENLQDDFQGATISDVNIGFLWAAFLKRVDLLGGFLEMGAQISFYEHNYGLSVLHIAAYSGCANSIEYLLAQKGCYVNLMCKCYSPLHCAAFGNNPKVASILLSKGANIDAFTNDLHCNLETVLHCAVRANAYRCLKLFCDKGANVRLVDSSGRTAMHLAAELGHTKCLQVLAETKRVNIDHQTKEKQQSALHFAAEHRHPECVDVLLEHGALVNITDYRHHTPLHLAAESQCNECVKKLLRKGKANPNLHDSDGRTALHLAVAKSSNINASDVIRTLIRYGAKIDPKDSKGCTPLHLAARNELSECVETLIVCGADITAKWKPGITALGIICRKTPSSIEAIRKKLDESIRFSLQDSMSKECELQIDFTAILQHCHPREISFLNTLLEEGQKDLLLHPVCRAFLHLKWKKIRKLFIFRAICCFLLVLTMSFYVLLGIAKHCYNFSKNITITTYDIDKDLCLNHSFLGSYIVKYPYIIEILWYLMVVFASGIAFRKLCGLRGHSSIFQYITSVENILDWSTVLTVFLLSCVYTGRHYLWQNHVSAFGVLLAWTNFLYILGQFPFFGTYIAMYSSVQREFAKLLLVFSCLLVGFTVSFCVLFPESEVFSNIMIGFITVLVMAIGEMNLDLITQPSEEEKLFMLKGSMEIIYAAFVTCVTIILLNLLVGIAVHDIQGLRKTAKLTKLTKATRLIYCIEKSLLSDYMPKKYFLNLIRWSTLVSSQGCCILTVKVHHHQRLLPQDILQSAYEVARKHTKRRRSVLPNSLGKTQLKRNIFRFDPGEIESELSDIRDDIRNLNYEVCNVKSMLENNQRLMEQILRVVEHSNDGGLRM